MFFTGAAQTVCRKVSVPTVMGTLCTMRPCIGSVPIPFRTQVGPRSRGLWTDFKKSFRTNVTMAAISKTAFVEWPSIKILTEAVKLRWLGKDTSSTSLWRLRSGRTRYSSLAYPVRSHLNLEWTHQNACSWLSDQGSVDGSSADTGVFDPCSAWRLGHHFFGVTHLAFERPPFL